VQDRNKQNAYRAGEVQQFPDLPIAQNPHRFAHIARNGRRPLVGS
jgi:hypothetical protein